MTEKLRELGPLRWQTSVIQGNGHLPEQVVVEAGHKPVAQEV